MRTCSVSLIKSKSRALHHTVYGDGRTKYGAVRVSAVLYEGHIFNVQVCDGTVAAPDRNHAGNPLMLTETTTAWMS